MNLWAQYEAVRDWLRRMNPDWRRGQCCVNALKGIDFELHEKIRATPNDPYYLDIRIPAFEHVIRAHWQKKKSA